MTKQEMSCGDRARVFLLLAAGVLMLSLVWPPDRPAGLPSPDAEDDCPLVVLLTDFGETDHYVGAMKGAVLSACPRARLVDITHQVPSFDVPSAARTLFLAAREFPRGTVFVAVVDPGVGTPRRAVVVRTGDGKLFVAPDNGLLTLVMEELGVAEARVVENPSFMRPGSISRTFQGRDIFGPVGGHLAGGRELAEVGSPAEDLVHLSFPEAFSAGEVVRGEVEKIDTYGNVLTNIGWSLVHELGAQSGDTLLVTFGELEISLPLVATYGDVPSGKPLALIESRGKLELAINQGHMGRALGVTSGTPVEVRRKPPAARSGE